MVTIGDLINSYPGGTDADFGVFKPHSLRGQLWNRAPRPSQLCEDWTNDTALGSVIVFTYFEHPPEGWLLARTYWHKLYTVRQQTLGGIIIVGLAHHIERRTWFQNEADAVEATLLSN